MLFDKQFLRVIADSDWFSCNAAAQIALNIKGETDYTKYDPTDDFRRLTEKRIQDGGYKIPLPDDVETKGIFHEINQIFNNFTMPQVFLILYGLWYGLTETEIMLYAKPKFRPAQMENIMHFFTLYRGVILPERIFRTFANGYSQKGYEALMKELWKNHTTK